MVCVMSTKEPENLPSCRTPMYAMQIRVTNTTATRRLCLYTHYYLKVRTRFLSDYRMCSQTLQSILHYYRSARFHIPRSRSDALCSQSSNLSQTVDNQPYGHTKNSKKWPTQSDVSVCSLHLLKRQSTSPRAKKMINKSPQKTGLKMIS